MNRLTNLVWKSNLTAVASFYYQLGMAGNRTNLSETVDGASRTYDWNYDPLYRLINENISGFRRGRRSTGDRLQRPGRL